MLLLTAKALPSTTSASDWTCGVASSVITPANACWPPVEPLPMSILPPCLTQVTDAGFTPARAEPPTVTCVPLLPLELELDAVLAVWPPLEQATSAAAQPRVPIAPARRRFTGDFLPSCA